MLFKLKSVFVSTGRDSDKPEKININVHRRQQPQRFWLLPPMLSDKIETSLNLFSLFVSRGLSFHDTQTQIPKTQTPGNK